MANGKATVIMRTISLTKKGNVSAEALNVRCIMNTLFLANGYFTLSSSVSGMTELFTSDVTLANGPRYPVVFGADGKAYSLYLHSSSIKSNQTMPAQSYYFNSCFTK